MRERKPTLGHWMEYLGWKGVGWVLKLLPRRALIAFADAGGILWYDILRLRRRVVDENLAIALGNTHSAAERRRIARRSVQNGVLTFFEFLQPEPLFARNWSAFVRMEGLDHARPFFGGKAAIMVTGHIGNWESMAQLLEPFNIRMLATAKPMHNPLVQDLILQGRARYPGLEMIAVQAPMKPIVSAARAGKWVMIMVDQDARRQGIFVEFFGRPASTAQGPALFAWKLNVPLIPVFCVRERDPNRSLALVIKPPIFPNSGADKDEEIRRLTELHTKALEEVVREHPEDYFWLHRRWKTKPKPAQPGTAAVPAESDEGEEEEE